MNPPLPNEPVPTRKINHKKSKLPRSKELIKNTKQVDTNDNKDTIKEDNGVIEKGEDDGWEHHFDNQTQRFFFYNTKTKIKQWINPRVTLNDECNQNLPTFEPPKLSFEIEETTPYELELKKLKNDSNFQKLSTFEKYKQVESLKKKFEDNQLDDQSNSNITSTELQNELKDIKPFKDDVNFNDYGSKSLYSQELNQSIHTLNNQNSKKTNKNQNKVSKQQIKQFKIQKNLKKQDKLKKWLAE
ncbi:hypothetical protein BN7_4675 [Wickerhamomyces ciferrii]|uniref:WW domain-containing protein n=1 Tax=Wickerhamomyces ciferrii (strain ATCC 14091 / BCRC 22168 / CBS 111 / JCM 3599 / NBRC 0793 / NRRL Y-1031 F-60-10) TaxID=1206466 RepID=K0KSS3_WICCF|nr:uncharacterized protein BN7_4675 [Wickerhamomyces ciferrii]CCH45097.1 hypothetical protein BN7_4675 [Wickerhamomyces ciferrii]